MGCSTEQACLQQIAQWEGRKKRRREGERKKKILDEREDEEWNARGMKNRKVRRRKMGEDRGERCKTGEEEEVLEKIQKQGGWRKRRRRRKRS